VSSLRFDPTLVRPEGALAPVIPSARLRPSRAVVGLVAGAGRVVIVLAAVLVPIIASQPLDADAVIALGAVAGGWLVALRLACSAFEGLLGNWASCAVGACLALGALYLASPFLSAYRPTVFDLVVTAVGVVCSTAIWEWAVDRTAAARKRVLVVGTHGTAALVAHELDDVPDFEILPQAGALASLAPIVDAQRPDLIVLTDERTYGDALDRLLETPAAAGRVVGLSGFFEYTLRRVPVSHLSPAWFMSLVHLRQPLYGRWTKRAFDVVMAAIGLLVALPLMAVVAAVVSRSPGPLLFRQTRLGEGGRPFTILKFRTMVPDAESDGPQFAAERDPRLIPGGSLLRRAHLDELPQLWNVLRGEMSVVGPRPERPEVASSLEDAVPFWNRRLLVKPGVTGWAQVCCGYVADCAEMADKLAYDLWYLRNQSLLVDIAICLRTVGQLLGAFVPGLSPARGDAR
jgi:exopolysaccharide biosynthesis polyprenyl glycosylphosphotransferase